MRSVIGRVLDARRQMTRRDASWAVAGAVGAIICQILIGFVVGIAPYVKPIAHLYDAKLEGDQLVAELRPLLQEFASNRDRINTVLDGCQPNGVTRTELLDMFVRAYDLAMVRGEVEAYRSVMDQVTHVLMPEHIAPFLRRMRESVVKQRDLSAAAIPYVEAVCS